MGEALVGAKVIVGPNGTDVLSTVAVGKTRSPQAYEPDREAYAPWKQLDGTDIVSPVEAFLKAAKDEKVVIEARLLAADGKKRIDVTLNEAQAKLLVDGQISLREIASAAKRDEIIREGTRLRESGKLTEDGPFNDDDFGSAGTPWYSGMGGWQPDLYLALGNGPFNRQLYLHDMWSMQAKAFWARTHDPVAKAGLEIVVDFVLGRGYSIVANDPLVQKEWDTFWKLNRGDEKLTEWLMDGQTDGNMFHRFFPQFSGPPKVALLDATTIWEIFTDPENVDDPLMYWQQYQTPYTTMTMPGLDSFRYVIRQIPADEILHTKFNASSAEKFGRSDLYPVLGWLKRLRDYYDAETIKAMIQAAFAWWFKLTGNQADVTAVQAFAAGNPPPALNQPGQAFYTNDAVEITALQADKVNTTTGGIGIGDGLLSVIAVGLRLAKDYFGVTSRGSLGQDPSKTAETPSIKHFENRQKVMRNLFERMAEKVVKIGQAEKRLPLTVRKPIGVKDVIAALRKGDLLEAMRLLSKALQGGDIVPLDPGVNVIFPAIMREDREALIRDVERAEANNYISKRQAAQIIARGFDVDNYDFDETQDEIAEEMAGKTTSVIARTGEQVQKGEPAPGMLAFPPGVVPNPAGRTAPATNGKAATESVKKLLTIEME